MHSPIDRLERAFAFDPRVTAGRAFSARALKVDGKIFVLAVGERLVLKLPAGRVDALVAEGRADRFDPGGRAWREWAAFHDEDEPFETLAAEAYAFVVAERGGRGGA